MAAPTFQLHPCPMCSSRQHLERPMWRYAHRTSLAKGPTYFWTGCLHAQQVCSSMTTHTEESWPKVEAAWKERCEVLFAQRTEKWTDHQRANFRAAMAEKIGFVGETERLPLESTPENSSP